MRYSTPCWWYTRLRRDFTRVQHHPSFFPKYLFRSLITKIDNFQQKVVDFLSKPQAWYIIRRQAVYHQRRRAAFVSHHGVAVHIFSCGLMIYNSCGVDEIQHSVLMIYTASPWFCESSTPSTVFPKYLFRSPITMFWDSIMLSRFCVRKYLNNPIIKIIHIYELFQRKFLKWYNNHKHRFMKSSVFPKDQRKTGAREWIGGSKFRCPCNGNIFRSAKRRKNVTEV